MLGQGRTLLGPDESPAFFMAPQRAIGVTRGKANLIVPGFPWRLVMPALKLLPDSLMKKIF